MTDAPKSHLYGCNTNYGFDECNCDELSTSVGEQGTMLTVEEIDDELAWREADGHRRPRARKVCAAARAWVEQEKHKEAAELRVAQSWARIDNAAPDSKPEREVHGWYEHPTAASPSACGAELDTTKSLHVDISSLNACIAHLEAEREALRAEVERLRELFRIDGEQHAAHCKALEAQHKTRIEAYGAELAASHVRLGALEKERADWRATAQKAKAELEACRAASARLKATHFSEKSDAFRAAAREENEACARAAYEYLDDHGESACGEAVAAAIRARAETKP